MTNQLVLALPFRQGPLQPLLCPEDHSKSSTGARIKVMYMLEQKKSVGKILAVRSGLDGRFVVLLLAYGEVFWF